MVYRKREIDNPYGRIDRQNRCLRQIIAVPTYEYECEKSGERFDIFQKSMNGNPLKACSFCGGPVRRIISSEAGIIPREASFTATD